MKRELSGGCGILILAFAALLIIFGIVAVFDMRADGDGADGALGLLVFVAMLSPFIYWGYVMLYKFLRPDEPVRFTKKMKLFGGAALLALVIFALWAALTSKNVPKISVPITEIAQEPNEPKDSVVITEVMEGDPYKELDELIGLESVKEEVHTIASQGRGAHHRQLRQDPAATQSAGSESAQDVVPSRVHRQPRHG